MAMDQTTARFADEIRNVYRANPQQAHQEIERLLESRLGDQSADQRQKVIQELSAHFDVSAGKRSAMEDDRMRRLFGLVLGRAVDEHDLASAQFLERLAQSLNTIFDTLNQLISVINMSFSPGDANGEQTIRQYIGFHLEGGDQTRTLEDYLGQISSAFLTSHDAFKKAHRTKVEQVLRALDPDQLAKERSSGLKIGPMRKAEDFDILSERIGRIKQWFDSGRFMEDFLREFEHRCETLNRNPK